MKNRVITIDGPAGVGKTTLAGRLAGKLELPYMDTGAMFRFFALNLGEAGLTCGDAELRAKCRQWDFSLEGMGTGTALLCNGEPVGAEIRTEAVSALASKLGSRPEIREILKLAQRKLGSGASLVAEGRDMGTVVFPHACFKFFLDARPEVRAMRRWRELEAKGAHPDYDELAIQMRKRDEHDRNRPVAPLKPAPDAIIIDTSDIGIEEVLALMLDHI